MERQIEPEGQEVIGVDVARFGDDKSVFVKRKGLKMVDMQIYAKLSVVEVAQKVIQFIDNKTSTKILLDATGVGGGVADILRTDGFNVVDINFGGKPKDSDKYNNVISEMWFEFKDNLDQIQLMNDSALKSQLCTREWKMDNKERRCIESKDDYKKRGFKSPDIADACLLCYYNQDESTGYVLGRLF
jgi:phage terminase large subunit